MTNTARATARQSTAYAICRESALDFSDRTIAAYLASSDTLPTQRLALVDHVTATTSMHYQDYRAAFDGWSSRELRMVQGRYSSDVENLAAADALRFMRTTAGC